MAQDNKSPLYTLYESLKADNYDVPDTYESFERTLNASGNEGTNNRMTLYNSLKENNYDVPDTYESFANTLFAPERPAAPTTPVDTLATPTPPPATPTSAQYFKLRRGGKDFTVSTDEVNAAGGLAGWAAANPGAPLRVYMQGKKDDGTDFDGHVDLSVAHDRSKQRGYKYTTTSEAIEDKPWQPTEQEKIAISRQLNQVQAQTDAMFAETRERMENVSEYYRGNRSLGFQTVEGKPVLNPETGKMEKTYLTPTGDRTTSKTAANMSTFNFRQAMASADMSVGAQIRRAEADLAELKRKYEDSKGRVHGEWADDYKKNDAPLAAVLAANTYVPRQMSDKENSALRVAIRQREEQLKDLYEERDRQIGKDVGFWRGFGRVVSDSRTWDFGTGDLMDAMTMLNVDKYSAPDATEGEKQAGQEMLKAIHDKQQVEEMYGGNASFWNRAGVMTGYMPSFMLDFALTGGGYEVINVAGKAAARGTAKLIGEAAIKEMTELGVKAYAKKYGVRGVGRMAENWTIKALGTTADDLLIRAPLMTNTVQVGKTAADIIDRKLGDVVVDANGNYDFSNDKTWGSAIWQGEANAIIENYSEMFGAHLDGVVPALAKTFGGKRISGMLARANASSYGQILATTRKQFERLGVSDYFGEVSEEYYGQLWRTMLNLDDAYTNVPVYDKQGNQVLDEQGNPVYERKNLLFTGQFHGDIWGGMALSMGLMGAGKYTLSGIAYGSMKHQVNKADRKAAEIFTPERWEPIREIIDSTTNDDMGALAESMVNDPNLSDEERTAVLGYMERSLNLRGLNLGAMAQSRGVEDEEGAEMTPSIEMEIDSELSQSYIDGYEASSPQEMNDAQNMFEYQRQRVEGMFDPSVLESLDGNPIATLMDMSQTGLYSPEEIDAARDYINAKTVRDGILQRVNDNIDEQIAQSDAMINGRVNRQTGMIQPAVMGLDDRQVYVVGGILAVNEDGSIDRDASDKSIVVRDAQTGKVEFSVPKSIVSAGEAIDPEMEKAIAVDNIRQQAAQAAADALNGILPLNPGDVVPIIAGGSPTTFTIVGPAIDEQAQSPIPDTFVVEWQNGIQTSLTREQIQAYADEEAITRLNNFEQERAAVRTQQQATEAEALRPQFALNDEFTILNDNGTPIRGSITGELDEDGTVEIYTEEPINGKLMNRYTPDELEQMFDTYNGQTVTVPKIAENVPNIEETPENAREISENSTETVPNPDEAAPMQPQQTALSNIPLDEQGQPNYIKADADTAWDAIVEQSGDEEIAAEVVADYVNEAEADFNAAEKALSKTKEGKPEKRKAGDPAPTMEERIAAKKAAKEALGEAQAIRDRAKYIFDQWKKIAGTKQRREAERRSTEDAEARRRAEERAAEEARLRAEREEAERIEREALNGVPDWSVDTPADARARGYRRNGPQKVDRPEIIDNHALGNSVEVKFGDEVMPKSNIVVIDASQLQPSHRDGQRNPAHFLDEAQPKERKDAASRFAAAKIAEAIRPEEITSSVTAYTGAPSVNSRGEVIQGNNRSEALRLMYESYADSAAKYKQYLIDHATEFGFTTEAIEAFEQPVLVNMLDVSDENAITLGQYVAQDTESGGIERIKPKNAVQKMGDKIRNFANLLLRSADDEATFAQLVDANGINVLKWMNQQGFITNTQYASAFDSKGNLTAEAANDLKGIMYQSIFTGGSTRLEEMFNKMPAKAQRAILATAFRDYDSILADRMISEIQQSIIAFDALMGYEQFRDAANAEASQHAVEAWKLQFAFDDVSGKPYLPSETFSNFALALAAMYKGSTQKHIQSVFNMMYDIVQGTEQDNLFEAADKTPKPLAEAIRRVLNLEYQPITKQITDNGTNGSAVLDINSEDGQDGRSGSDGNADGAEQHQEETEPADSGTGTASDSGQRDGIKSSLGDRVKEAEAEVNTDPTPAQKEAGNYKKGHVQIGTFDVTIEQPVGSVRRGTDADGKEWETTMQNTYGYIRGTEGVDGDHIDVFLSDNIDGWNGRRVVIVDQYNPDGTFDEHKVMLGFNDKADAINAYLANYEEGWNKDRRLVFSSAIIDDFEKWIESSHRKQKPYHEYKIAEKAEIEESTPENPISTSSVWTADHQFWIDLIRNYINYNNHIDAECLDFEPFLANGGFAKFYSLFGDGYEQILDTLNNESKTAGHSTLAQPAEIGAETQQDATTDYTIDTYTTKKGKTYHRVVFPRADKAVWQERLNLAKKMGGTSVPKGYGFKTREEAEAFAKAVADPTAVADNAKPWSEMNGEERLAEAVKHPLTESEIMASGVDEIIRDNALDYTKGHITPVTTISYLNVYEHVRNTNGDSGRADGVAGEAQLGEAHTGELVGGERRTEGDGGGEAPGRLDNGGSGESLPGLHAGENSPRLDDTSAGVESSEQMEGEQSAVGIVSPDNRRPGLRGDVDGSGSNGRKGSRKSGTKTSRGNRGGNANATARTDGAVADAVSELDKALSEFKDVLREFGRAGRNEVTLSIVGMNNRQLELMPRLIAAGVKVGYQLIKTGVTRLADWSAKMRDMLSVPMTHEGFTDMQVDEWVKELWDSDFTVDGVRQKLSAWASQLGAEGSREIVRNTLEEKRKLQKNAESIEVNLCDAENIESTLPFLLPQQREDVMRAETQFFDPEHADREHAYGKGYMFTNGTGTGKTYTGLGIVKRFVKQGKGRVLILTPSQPKVADWIKDGKNLGLSIRSLEDWASERGTTATTERGEGVIITTFANFRQNEALLEDEFDLVVYDESHRLMENKDGQTSAGTRQHYLVSNRNENYAFTRLQKINPHYRNVRAAAERYVELLDKLRIKGGDVNVPMLGDRWSEADKAAYPELWKIKQEHDEYVKVYSEIEPELKEQAKKSAKRTKVVFLSATPFNTRANLDYAEGYIFSYPEDKDTKGGYMNPRTRFYLDHFGAAYRFRYHRLEARNDNADAVARQEVEFSDWLQNDLQTMSGRIIDSEYDYSRDFPLVTGDYAARFNEVCQQMSGSEAVRQAFWEVFGNYNYSSALFEAMKASQVVKRIKRHIELGRKIVVFHRRQESRTPLRPPFSEVFALAERLANESRAENRNRLLEEIRAMRRECGDMLEWEKTLDLRMPRHQLEEAFGEDKICYFSGTESTKVKKKSVDDFNNDDSGKNIIVVQEASGKEGISLHDTTGKHQRVCITLALPQSPITALQIEGRTYRIGNRSNAIFEYPLLGLDMEMILFGQTFNARVGTTENLALGSKARDLRGSFARGVEEHSGEIPPESQGTGGKEFDGGMDASDYDGFDRAVLDFYGNQKLSGRRDNREGVDYFPTPEPLGYMMAQWGHIGEGDRVLEPSAGHGAIARYVPTSNMLTAIEPSNSLFAKLQMRCGGTARKYVNSIFEGYDRVNKQEVVLMNPPFGSAGRMAVDHVAKAFTHLTEGGRVVAIIPMGSTTQKFEKWYNEQKDAHLVGEVLLPDITFQQAGTAVRCRVVVVDKITKPELAQRVAANYTRVDLSGRVYERIEDFFEDVRYINMSERTIDYRMKLERKAQAGMRELKSIKNVEASINDMGVMRVSGPGIYESIDLGSLTPENVRGKMAELFKVYAQRASRHEGSESQRDQQRLETYEEMKRLTAKLADMSVEEMERYVESEDDVPLRSSDNADDFATRQQRAVKGRGFVMPGLNDVEVKVVEVPRHDFKGTGKEALKAAEDWAKTHIVGTHTAIDSNGSEFEYSISNDAVEKYVSRSATAKSENIGVHLAVLKKLPEIIGESIEAEVHPSYNKGYAGLRGVENGYNSNALTHRFYGAARIDGQLYRIKTTIIEENLDHPNTAHSYEVAKIEVLAEKTNTSDDASPSQYERVRTAKLLQGVEKSYDFGKKLLDESEASTPEESENSVLCRPITDKATLDRLNSEPTIKVYRAMQMIDGGLRPPMSARVDGELREATEVGVWEEAEEHPEMADENGRFKLDKGNGKSIKAAYNPYIHTSRSPINDQFSSAWSRPELVTVEVEVPVSELTSGYHAEKAKDCVGEKEWKSGPVGRALAKIGQARKVILSRWSRIVRVVPVEEVAEAYAQRLNAHGIEVPFNTVPPALRDALVERGVKIGKPEKGNAGNASMPAFEQWIAKQERQRMGDGYGAYTDAEISYFNDPMSKALGKNRFSKKRQAEFAARERQRMVTRIQELAECMHLDNVEIITDASQLEGKRAKAKGFYNKRTGKITIVIPNNVSTIDAEQTLLHEAVAHYGLRQLFGEHFNTFLDNVYQSADESIRRKIAEMAAKNGWDFRTATEEYLAGLAEDTSFSEAQNYTGWWSKIKRLFLDMLDKIGFEGFRDKVGVVLTDNELRYILWRSYQNLARPGRYRSILGEAADVVKQSELKVGNYAEQSIEAEYAAEGDLYRPGDFSPRDRVIARDAYNRVCASGSYQFQEAVQDSMLGLKALYHAVLGKKIRIEDVAGFENAYLFENRMNSKNAGEQHEYFQRYMQPLLKEIGCIAGANERKRRELTDYIMAKHGLERNEYMRNEATANGEDSDRDFAGLIGLTGEADWQAAEDTARQWVDDYEAMYDTTPLWDAINKATKATLEKVYLSGIISKETYEKILGMYNYYVPLRGWNETTSNEVYGYLTSKNGPLSGNIMKKAEGRESMADDPIATIAMMADDAIRQGNRNLMKQRFLNFILNHPSDAVSVHDLWLEYNEVTDEWVPVFADIEETDTADVVEQKVKDFEERMEALRTSDPDKYKKGREAQHIPYKVVHGNLREHQILIKRNGRTFVVTINGNPRAAQAINGLTNPDVDQNGVVGNMLKAGTWVNRQLSAFYTTRNPDFVVGNFFRDMLYSNCMTWVKESPRYALRFHKNFARVNPIVMRRLLGKWENGTLNMGNRLESLFYQFMKNGGETGYTNVRDIEGHKRAVASELKKQGSTGRKAWTALGMQLDLLNRSAENCARFAAFITSRDFGRGIDRSIYDAKEISVNFNKKGSGGKMVNATGQTKLGKAGAYLSGGGRLLYVFWNAGIQGMTNFGRQAKLHPGKFTVGATALFTLGYVIPILAQMLGGGDGDDDDKNAYYNLPEYVRRSNICFYAGDRWITIPLPIEYRAMYGMGELAHGVISGNERYRSSELAHQMASQVSQIMPLDMLEGGGGISPVIPSAAKPFTEAYIMNKGWTGLPVYKDTPFNKNDPEWTKAYASTDTHLVDFAKWLNETSGGDDFKKGSIDINPAKIEYLLNGTFGGLFTFPNKIKKSAETAFGDRDFEWRNMPIANRLIKSGDERTANRKLKNEYFKYLKEYEATGQLMRKYENADANGIMGYAERINFLENSPEYLSYEIFDDFKADIDAYQENIAEETDKEKQSRIESEMYATMRELINALHNPQEYFKKLYDAGQLSEDYIKYLRTNHGIKLEDDNKE